MALLRRTAVGYFNRAMMLCRMPDKLNAGLISVALPAFSTVAREGAIPAKAYLRALELVTVIVAIAGVIDFVCRGRRAPHSGSTMEPVVPGRANHVARIFVERRRF